MQSPQLDYPIVILYNSQMTERPKYSEEQKVNAYLASLTRRERRDGQYELRRGLERYIGELDGLVPSLAYVRDHTTSNLILDIGAGEAIGINELAKDSRGEDLEFAATGLVAPDNPDKVPYLVTSGEYLKGVGDESVGGALALYSITYSPSPEMVVNALDRVLVPGGIVKTRLIEVVTFAHAGMYISHSGHFVPYFERKGYDIATTYGFYSSILLAKKPGGNSQMSAGDLLQRDRASLPK